MSNRRIFILIPPPADPTMPMLGPFVLANFLREKEVSVRVYDVSIAFFKNALDENCIRQCGVLAGTNPAVIDNAVNMAYTTRATSSDNMQSMLTAAAILSSLQNAIHFSLDGAEFCYTILTTDLLKNAINGLKWTDVLFARQAFWEDLSASSVDYIGISVAYSAQLPFALFIAQQIKKYYPKKRIFLGGSYFENYEIAPSAILHDFTFIDQIITGAGEASLLALLGDTQIEKDVIHSDNVQYSLLPDFSDAPWGDYCVEHGIRSAPFSFRTRCYYGKCAFCSGDNQMPTHNLTPQRVQEIIAQLKRICKQQNITHIYFTDAALPLVLMQALAKTIAGNFCWAINARIEQNISSEYFAALYTNGCRMLRIGMESASQKVLNLMHKGHNVQHYSDFFDMACNAGIKLHIYIMYGFPDEKDEDREQTLQFLRAHLPQIYSYTISIFHAIPGTKIFYDLVDRYHLDQEQPEQDINQRLYTEEHYQTMLQWVQRTVISLAPAHTNQFCYGGRVFMEHPEVDNKTTKENILQNCNYVSSIE